MAGIYVHIPFCHSKCAYCDFYSLASTHLEDEFASAIVREYALRCDEISSPITTIYLGGGTPSILSHSSLSTILDAFPKQDVAEFTIEANPEDINPEAIARWRDMGINRVSMGVQSLVDSELSLIGRRHTAQQAISAINCLRARGISNFSIDLIYGLPTQSIESWRHSLAAILGMRPTHFSAYMLSYEPRTRLTAMLKTGKITELDESVVEQMYQILIAEAAKAGYCHYEISNFALPGYEAKHNSNYWNGTPYLGLGPGAHSFDGRLRRINPSNLKQYLAVIQSGNTAFEIDEETDDNEFNDLVMTALRTAAGLSLSDVPEHRLSQLMSDARQYIASGALLADSARLWIPEDKWLISDAIISDLFQV